MHTEVQRTEDRVPANQLKLTPDQLNEIYPRVINANDPNVPKGVTRFHYLRQDPHPSGEPGRFVTVVEGKWRKEEKQDHLAVHFVMDGNLILADSEDGREQLELKQRFGPSDIPVSTSSVGTSTSMGAAAASAADAASNGAVSGGGNSRPQTASGDAAAEDEDGEVAAAPGRPLKNQFNFSERAAQTFNNPLRNRAVSTEPPPLAEFEGNVTHWEIFDTYIEDMANSLNAVENKTKKTYTKEGEEDNPAKELLVQKLEDLDVGSSADGMASSSVITSEAQRALEYRRILKSENFSFACQLLERIVNQNSGEEVYRHFRLTAQEELGADGSADSPSPAVSLESPAPVRMASSTDKSATGAVSVSAATAAAGARAPSRVGGPAAPTGPYSIAVPKGAPSVLDAKGYGGFKALWSLNYAPAANRTVTCLRWNPQFSDLLAVGYGSYDFNHVRDRKNDDPQASQGYLCCFSLKCPSYPQYVFRPPASVTTLQWHPQHPTLLAVGLHDGTVCVYDVRKPGGQPLYISSDPKTRHTDPVWQVYWQNTEPGQALTFLSISGDGRILSWSLTKNELLSEPLMSLKLTRGLASSEAPQNPDADGDALEPTDQLPEGSAALSGGSCFDFNPKSESLFVVGTEEGELHTYSKAYPSHHIQEFEGHHMVIYSTRWNPYHPSVLLTCSADWSIKLWESGTPKPVMTFDLKTSVSDVDWAPFSSTVFAAVTTDGRLRLYDLHVDKHAPIAVVRAPRKARLSQVAINKDRPIVCVGDDLGSVTVYKLSGRVRSLVAPSKQASHRHPIPDSTHKQDDFEGIDARLEREKLDHLLIIDEDMQDQDPLAVMTKNTRMFGTKGVSVMMEMSAADEKSEQKQSATKTEGKEGTADAAPRARSPAPKD